MLERLRDLAIKYQTICQQAPNIWDAENTEDSKIAQNGCNGTVSVTKGQQRTPPCPIKNLCLQTAITTQSHYGVWGGMTSSQRLRLRKKR